MHHQNENFQFLAGVDPVAQQVEHNTFNVGVPGSSPGGITENQAVTVKCNCFFLFYTPPFFAFYANRHVDQERKAIKINIFRKNIITIGQYHTFY